MSRRGKKSRAPVSVATPTNRLSTSASPTSAGGSGINEPPHEVAVRFADLPGDHNTQLAIPDMVLRGPGPDAHIIVRIPGMVLDLISRMQLDVEHLMGVVLDETDNMLDLRGLREQFLRVKQNIASSTQIALFPASFPEQVFKYANRFAQNAK
ncbi:hypothetical protein HOY82DRAFT_579433 [Tuber indicum]|nr:hypothetical protein HOY82DRAFT_579433 [Tuber indicum]